MNPFAHFEDQFGHLQMSDNDAALHVFLAGWNSAMMEMMHRVNKMPFQNDTRASFAVYFQSQMVNVDAIEKPAQQEMTNIERHERNVQKFLAEQPAQQEQYIGETNVELGFYSNDASNGQQRELVGKVEMGQLVGNRPHESTSNPDTEREIAVITGVDEHGPMLGWFKHWINYPVGTKLYTSPPAQKEPFGYFKAEPFGWTDCAETDEGAVALYERPPAQRTWVGLTDREIDDLYCEHHDEYGCQLSATGYERAIEAKLKEKNA